MQTFTGVAKPIAVIVWAMVLAGVMISLVMGWTSRGSGSHFPSVSWLPNTATDISFREIDSLISYFFVYECSIEPEDFKQLAREKGWNLKEKRDFYGADRSFLNLPDFRVEPGDQPNRIPYGLVFENVMSNGGGTRVAYDPERKRLLVSQSTN